MALYCPTWPVEALRNPAPRIPRGWRACNFIGPPAPPPWTRHLKETLL